MDTSITSPHIIGTISNLNEMHDNTCAEHNGIVCSKCLVLKKQILKILVKIPFKAVVVQQIPLNIELIDLPEIGMLLSEDKGSTLDCWLQCHAGFGIHNNFGLYFLILSECIYSACTVCRPGSKSCELKNRLAVVGSWISHSVND